MDGPRGRWTLLEIWRRQEYLRVTMDETHWRKRSDGESWDFLRCRWLLEDDGKLCLQCGLFPNCLTSFTRISLYTGSPAVKSFVYCDLQRRADCLDSLSSVW
jgi:5-methylcytosine-specific restriction endonuclease McrA